MRARQPLKLSAEISSRLAYSATPDVDEFTLSCWRYSMERMKDEGNLVVEDYSALAQVYFALRRYDDFERILAEGIEKWQNLTLLGDLKIGSLLLASNHKYRTDPSGVLSEWFAHELNKDKLPLKLTAILTDLFLWARHFTLSKAAALSATVMGDGTSALTMGPLSIEVPTEVLDGYDYDFGQVLFDEYASKIVNGLIEPEVGAYLEDVFSANGYATLLEYLRDLRYLTPEEQAEDEKTLEEAAELYRIGGVEAFAAHHGIGDSDG